MADVNVKLNYHQSATECHNKLVGLCDKWEMDDSGGSTMRLDVDDEFMATIYSTVRILSKMRGDQ